MPSAFIILGERLISGINLIMHGESFLSFITKYHFNYAHTKRLILHIATGAHLEYSSRECYTVDTSRKFIFSVYVVLKHFALLNSLSCHFDHHLH
ncbi:hypothetical protein ACJX0J_012650, partial [Zea mays]